MEKSPDPGIPSCPPVVDPEEVSKSLAEICKKSEICEIKDALGDRSKLHIVGGTVRDLFCGKQLGDIDLSSVFTPEESKQLLEAKGIRVVETGIKHGTLTVVINGRNIELTTFRKPSQHHVNSYSDTIEEDLSGRDFTINAIAFSIDSNEIIDPFGGQRDLVSGTVKAVLDPEARFREDPLRMLRALRFGTAEGREIQRKTLLGIESCADLIDQVSVERVREEFVKILVSDYSADALQVLLDIGLLERIIPELLKGVGFEQNDFHIHDVFEHTLWVLERSKPTPLQRLTALFHDISKPDTLSTDENNRRHFYQHENKGAEASKQIMQRLKFSKQEIKDVSTLVRYHMRPLDCGPSGVRRLIRDLDHLFEDWMDFKVADSPPTMNVDEFEAMLSNFREMAEIEQEKQKLPSYGKLSVSGEDLISIGMKPGRELGEILGSLEEIVLNDPEKNEKNLLIEEAKKLIGNQK